MKLTPQMQEWNRRIKEGHIQSEEYLKKSSDKIKEIYWELKENILKLSSEIKIIYHKNYISFKSLKNFVDVQPQKESIKCIINVKKDVLKDPKRILRDISNVGHFGSGDYELILCSLNEIPYVITLIKQSHNLSS